MTMLPENSTYDQQNEATRGFAQAAGRGVQQATAALPSPKKVDTSQFSGLVQRVASAQRQQAQSPAMRSSASQQMANAAPPNTNQTASWVNSGQGIDTRQLGATTTPFGGRTRFEKFHPGLDIAAPIGTPQPAFAGGKVTEVATGKKHGEKGFGNYVVVQDKDGRKWRYSHLQRSWVKVGQEIEPGYVFGEIGNTGSAYSTHGGTGAHLDLRVTDAYNRFINPADLGVKS